MQVKEREPGKSFGFSNMEVISDIDKNSFHGVMGWKSITSLRTGEGELETLTTDTSFCCKKVTLVFKSQSFWLFISPNGQCQEQSEWVEFYLKTPPFPMTKRFCEMCFSSSKSGTLFVDWGKHHCLQGICNSRYLKFYHQISVLELLHTYDTIVFRLNIATLNYIHSFQIFHYWFVGSSFLVSWPPLT